MNFLITGCAGFIGFHLTKKLINNGHKVTGIDSLSDYYDMSLINYMIQCSLSARHTDHEVSVTGSAERTVS